MHYHGEIIMPPVAEEQVEDAVATIMKAFDENPRRRIRHTSASTTRTSAIPVTPMLSGTGTSSAAVGPARSSSGRWTQSSTRRSTTSSAVARSRLVA